jgi:hypothetical protein
VRLSELGGTPVGSSSTDPDGRFRITAEDGGVYGLLVETLFHGPVTVDSLRVGRGEELALGDIELEPIPLALDELTVQVERRRLTPGREWVRRNQSHGKGTFLPGAVVALQAGASVASYVADQTRLWVRFDERGRPALINPAGSLSRCVNVLVNRWRLERTGFLSLDEIPRSDIAAIEIYENERDLPPGYYFDGTPGCGVINVWLWNSW